MYDLECKLSQKSWKLLVKRVTKCSKANTKLAAIVWLNGEGGTQELVTWYREPQSTHTAAKFVNFRFPPSLSVICRL